MKAVKTLYEEYSMDGVENLLEFFDTEQTAKTIREHILTDSFGLDLPIDHYKPYYAKFKTLESAVDNGVPEDIVKDCRHKARVIAIMFIDAILKKYQLRIDEHWVENMGENEVQGLTIILYDFFVLRMKEYLFEVITRYIDANAKMLADQLDTNSKVGGGATYAVMLKILPEEYAIIGANIYDVCYIVLNNLSELDYINHVSADNEIQPHLKKFFEEAKITGNFMDAITTMVDHVGNGLKSYLGFEIISYLKRTYGHDTEN